MFAMETVCNRSKAKHARHRISNTVVGHGVRRSLVRTTWRLLITKVKAPVDILGYGELTQRLVANGAVSVNACGLMGVARWSPREET